MPMLNHANSANHQIKNLGVHQRETPHSSPFAMLSDSSSAFRVNNQGSGITTNGVKTSVTVKRCFDSVLDLSIQTDWVANFNKRSLNMTRESENGVVQ
jgi:hypothetical protein